MKQVQEASEAYVEVSKKDKQKRQRYDQFGHAGVGGASGGGPSGGNPFGGGFDFNGQNINFDFGGGFGDIFSQFFGGGQQTYGPTKGRDVEARVTLDFEEAVFGKEVKLSLKPR